MLIWGFDLLHRVRRMTRRGKVGSFFGWPVPRSSVQVPSGVRCCAPQIVPVELPYTASPGRQSSLCHRNSESWKYQQHLGIGDLIKVSGDRKSFISWEKAGRKLASSGHRTDNRQKCIKRWTLAGVTCVVRPRGCHYRSCISSTYFLSVSCKILPKSTG